MCAGRRRGDGRVNPRGGRLPPPHPLAPRQTLSTTSMPRSARFFLVFWSFCTTDVSTRCPAARPFARAIDDAARGLRGAELRAAVLPVRVLHGKVQTREPTGGLQQGQVTLSPVRATDPFGSAGWPAPDPRTFSSQKAAKRTASDCPPRRLHGRLRPTE